MAGERYKARLRSSFADVRRALCECAGPLSAMAAHGVVEQDHVRVAIKW